MRLPPNTNDEVDEDPTGNKALWDRGLLNGASQKVRLGGSCLLRSQSCSSVLLWWDFSILGSQMQPLPIGWKLHTCFLFFLTLVTSLCLAGR